MNGELFALILAFTSVIIGGYAIFKTIKFADKYKTDSEKQIGSLSNILERADRTVSGLERVEGSITTRSVGLFPDHIPIITEILRKAKDEIYIASEAGYGATSAAQLYIPYESAINGKWSQ